MRELLWLVPTLPLLGSAILMLGAGRLSTRVEAMIGALSVGLAAIIAFTIAAGFLLMRQRARFMSKPCGVGLMSAGSRRRSACASMHFLW